MGNREEVESGVEADIDWDRAIGCLVVASLAERVAQPFQTLVQTITRRGAGGLDVLTIVSFKHATAGPSIHTQARWRRLWRPSLSVISAAFMAF